MKTKKTTPAFSPRISVLRLPFSACFLLLLLNSGFLPFTSPVVIHSEPEGADVYETGTAGIAGVTPYKMTLFRKEKRLVLKKEGFFDEKVVITAETPEETTISLRPKPVLVHGKPNASIYEKGASKPFGTTPLWIQVFPEERTYTLKKAGYIDQKIVIGPDTDRPLIVELTPAPIIKFSGLSGIEVYENGSCIDTSSFSEAIASSRLFEFKRAGYKTKQIELTPDSSFPVSIQLERYPHITTSNTPSGEIEIYRDATQIATLSMPKEPNRIETFALQKNDYLPEPTSEVSPPTFIITTSPTNAAVFMNGQTEPLPRKTLILTAEKDAILTVSADRFISKTITLHSKNYTTNVILQAMPSP